MKPFNLFLFIVLFLTSSIVGAQTDDAKIKTNTDISTDKVTESAVDQPGIDALMTELVNGINVSAFKDGETGQAEVLKMLSGLGAEDINKYGMALGSLAGALNSSAFLPDWAENEKGILYQLQNAASVSDVAGGVLEMSGMIDRSSFTEGFVGNISSWQNSLEAISMAK
ncbi:MAG: hypothetical protein WAT71_13590 [Ignavibacteria bacterium]